MKKALLLALLVLFSFLASLPMAHSVDWDSRVRFQFPTGAYLYVTSNASFYNATTVQDCWEFYQFTYNGKTTNSLMLTAYISNVTLTSVDYNTQLAYTVDSAGTQSFFTEKLPTQVTINGVDAPRNGYWTYTTGWLNFTSVPASSTVIVYFAVTPNPATSPANYYFLSYTHTVNSETGYGISSQSGWTYTSISQTFSGAGTVDFAFSAELVHSNNPTQANENLTGSSPTAIISRATDGEGMQNSTAAVSEKALVINLNAIKVSIYVRFNSGAWLKIVDCVSDRLMQKKINAATWTFLLYTKVETVGGNTVATAYWGDQTRKSGIGGVVFTSPTPQEIALANGLAGDFISMILYPYVYLIGDIFYGIIILFIMSNLYLRYRKFEVVLVMFLLWGGTSGFGLLIPQAAYKIVYILLLLGFAWVLYKFTR